MKKNILYFACAIVVLALISYVTVAYFTAESTSTNVITSGKIDIILKDMTLNDKKEEIEFPDGGINGVKSGDAIDKLVYLQNVGENSAWVRVKLEKSVKKNGNPMLWPEDIITLDLNKSDWTKSGEYYYYNNEILRQEQTTKLFTKVKFGNLDKEYEGASFKIKVCAQAVQSKNNGDSIENIQGWPQED